MDDISCDPTTASPSMMSSQMSGLGMTFPFPSIQPSRCSSGDGDPAARYRDMDLHRHAADEISSDNGWRPEEPLNEKERGPEDPASQTAVGQEAKFQDINREGWHPRADD